MSINRSFLQGPEYKRANSWSNWVKLTFLLTNHLCAPTPQPILQGRFALDKRAFLKNICSLFSLPYINSFRSQTMPTQGSIGEPSHSLVDPRNVVLQEGTLTPSAPVWPPGHPTLVPRNKTYHQTRSTTPKPTRSKAIWPVTCCGARVCQNLRGPVWQTSSPGLPS